MSKEAKILRFPVKSIKDSVTLKNGQKLSEINSITFSILSLDNLDSDILDKSIEMLKNVKENITQNSSQIKMNTSHHIVLPLPNDLTSANNQNWSRTEGTFQNAANTFMTSKAGAILETVTGVNLGDKKNFDVIRASNEALIKSGNRQIMTNPGYYNSYGGPGERSWNFTFTLIPQSKEDSDVILEIIKIFQIYSSPSNKKMILQSPNYFKVNFSNKTLNDLFKMNIVVITGLTILVDGDHTVYKDGTFKQYNLTIQLTEAFPIYREDFENENYDSFRSNLYDGKSTVQELNDPTVNNEDYKDSGESNNGN